MNPAPLIFCLLGPTPEPGFSELWADQRLILSVEEIQTLSGHSREWQFREVIGVMWNAAGDEIPYTGSALLGENEHGEPVWKVTLTSAFRQQPHVGTTHVDQDPYYVPSINLHVPADQDLFDYGLRDDPTTQWATAWGHTFLEPEAISSLPGATDDHMNSAPVWSVSCKEN